MHVNKSYSSPLKFFIGFLFFLIITITSCTDDGENNPGSNDYYPLIQNSKRTYVTKYQYEDSSHDWVDTSIYIIKKDTLFEGVKYATVYNKYNNLSQFIRKDKAKYYGRNMDFYVGFNTEYLFLDEIMKVGGTWTHSKDEGREKSEYTIKVKGKERVINSIKYKDVIEVAINHFILEDGDYKKTSSAIKIYAKNIGEIYAYYYSDYIPYTREVNLLEYSIQ